jgi:hypothetical protein
MDRWLAACLRALCCVVVIAATCGAPATAANLLELNFWLEGPHYEGKLPTCQTPAALDKISSRFAQKEREFWNSTIEIVGYTHVHETAFRPWDRDLIPRRYCSARAMLSNGVERPIYYFIGEGYGMIGAGWGVEWCVVGYDRNWAYNPACKMARP